MCTYMTAYLQKDKYKIYLSLLFILATTLIVNWLTPISSDDFGRELDSMQPAAILSRYTHWSGRLVADILATLVLRLGQHIADIINSLFLVALIWIIATLAAKLLDKKYNSPDYKVILLVFFLYWICNPKLGHTTFWIVGAANYLWTNAFNFGFILAFLLALQSNQKISTAKIILISILGLLGGCSNENTALVSLILCIYLLYTHKDKHLQGKLPIIWLIAFSIGTTILLLAPGNFARMHIPSNMEWYNEPFWWRVWYHLIRRVPDSMMKYWEAYIVLFIGLYAIKLPKNAKKNILVFVIMALATNLALFSAPAFPKRALQGGYIYILVAVAIMFSCTKQVKSANKLKLVNIVLILCCLQWLVSFTLISRAFYGTTLQHEVRTNIIKDSIKKGDKYIAIPEFYFTTLLRSRDKFDIFFSGSSMARYYGTNAIIEEYPVNRPYSVKHPPIKAGE